MKKEDLQREAERQGFDAQERKIFERGGEWMAGYLSKAGMREAIEKFNVWLEDNHSIKVHDMILQDYFKYQLGEAIREDSSFEPEVQSLELGDLKEQANEYYKKLTEKAPQKGMGSHEYNYFIYGLEFAFNRLYQLKSNKSGGEQ